MMATNNRLEKALEHIRESSCTAASLARLIDEGIDINCPSANGRTLLHEAVNAQNIPCAKLLLTRGADIDAEDTLGDTPLGRTVMRDPTTTAFQMLELLLEHGANINAEAGAIGTVLHAAAEAGNHVWIRWLLEHGASPDSQNEDKETPAEVALLDDDTETAHLLDSWQHNQLTNSLPTGLTSHGRSRL